MSAEEGYFDSLEADLREKKDRTDELDELFQLSFLGDDPVKERVSWCVAKMAQNKVQDLRMAGIVSSLSDSNDPEVMENVAWGIGEMAGVGIGDEHLNEVILRYMSDRNASVRGMAVWAAGRLKKKMGVKDDRLDRMIQSLADDRSEYVRRSVQYALEP